MTVLKSETGVKRDFAPIIKEVFEYIPVLFILGILTGFGSFTAIFGAFIMSFVFIIFKRDFSFIAGVSVLFAVALAFFNVSSGGRSETLFALLFVTSLITILFSFLNEDNKLFSDIPKPVSSGFITGAFACAFVLVFPLICGVKTFGSTPLMFNSKHSIFVSINQNALICALCAAVIYHYLKKFKIKFLPPSFIAVLSGGVINYIYKFGLGCVNIGINSFSPVVTANFGHFMRLLFFGFILAALISSETFLNLKAAKKADYTFKKTLLFTGISNMISSVTGSISGTIAGARKNRKYTAVFEAAILFIFVLFFDKIGSFIPISAAASVFAIKMYETIKNRICAQKVKTFSSKIIYIFCAFAAFFNITAGFIFSFTFYLIFKILKKHQPV